MSKISGKSDLNKWHTSSKLLLFTVRVHATSNLPKNSGSFLHIAIIIHIGLLDIEVYRRSSTYYFMLNKTQLWKNPIDKTRKCTFFCSSPPSVPLWCSFGTLLVAPTLQLNRAAHNIHITSRPSSTCLDFETCDQPRESNHTL